MKDRRFSFLFVRICIGRQASWIRIGRHGLVLTSNPPLLSERLHPERVLLRFYKWRLRYF